HPVREIMRTYQLRHLVEVIAGWSDHREGNRPAAFLQLGHGEHGAVEALVPAHRTAAHDQRDLLVRGHGLGSVNHATTDRIDVEAGADLDDLLGRDAFPDRGLHRRWRYAHHPVNAPEDEARDCPVDAVRL